MVARWGWRYPTVTPGQGFLKANQRSADPKRREGPLSQQMKTLHITGAPAHAPQAMGFESNSALRAFAVLLIGFGFGLIGCVVVRHLYELSVELDSLREIWLGLCASGVAGAVTLFVATQLMAQSPPHLSRVAVVLFLLVGCALLSAIAASGLLLIIRFTNQEFFQGRQLDLAMRAVGVCAVMGAVAFLLAAPIRGFDLAAVPRAPKAPAPGKRRAVTKGIETLRRCPVCGSVIVKAYEATDPKAVKKGQKRHVCNKGHEWHA